MNVSRVLVFVVILITCTVLLLFNSMKTTADSSSVVTIRHEHMVPSHQAPGSDDSCQRIYRVALLFYYGGKKVSGWNDGFPAALRYLEANTCSKIIWIDLANAKCLPEFQANPKPWLEANADVIIVKSNWGWIPEKYAWKELQGITVPLILAVAGVGPPPIKTEPKRFLFYKALLYEVEWYYPRIEKHPVVIHAFGINDAFLKPIQHAPKIYDYIFIGALGKYKRVQELMSKKGRRLALGGAVDVEVVQQMKDDGIEVIPAVPYATLPAYLSMSKILFAPMPVDGGGERSVLEARACGVDVEFSELGDNPKLLELATSPVWNHEYYAFRIVASICHVLQTGKGSDGRLHMRANQKSVRRDVVGSLAACIPLRNSSAESICAA